MRLVLLTLAVSLLLRAQPAGQIGERLTANGLKADVSFLASDALQGRATPSPGQDIAAEYIAAQFRRAGLEPAGDDGYFQTALYSNVTPNPQGVTLTLGVTGGGLKAESAMMGIQEPAAADLSNTATVRVLLDSPAALTALTPEQVRGKILVVELPAQAAPAAGGGRGGNNAVLRRLPAAASNLGAALVILLRPNGQGINTNTRLREALAPAVPILSVWDPEFKNALAAQPEATLSVHLPPPAVVPVKLRNVVGILRGSDPVLKDTYLLLTAHYDHLGFRETSPGTDHIFNGANDDASGTASVIEIANALAALPNRPRRSIVFMTQYGEELGDLGSRYYAQHPIFPLAKTIADVNLEQLGRTDDTQGPRVGQFNLTGFDFTNISTLLAKAGEVTGIKAVKDEKNSDPYFTRSDNAAFAAAGVPSTTLSVAYDFPDYHKAGDEWQKIDYENMAKVDVTIALAALDIANSDVLPEWNSGNPATAQFVKARAH